MLKQTKNNNEIVKVAISRSLALSSRVKEFIGLFPLVEFGYIFDATFPDWLHLENLMNSKMNPYSIIANKMVPWVPRIHISI